MEINPPNTLLFGVDVMESFPSELDNLMMNRKLYMRIKNYLCTKSQSFFHVFHALLSQNDLEIQKKTIACVKAWCHLKMQFLECSSLVDKLLELSSAHPSDVFECLNEIIITSNESDILTSSSFENSLTYLNTPTSESVRKIVQRLKIYVPAFAKAKGEELVAVNSMAELCTNIACKFPLLIAQPTEICQFIFEILEQVFACKSLKTSYITFDLYNQIQTLTSHIPQSFLTHFPDFLLRILDYLCLKCMSKEIGVNVLRKKDSEEELELGELDLIDYRNFAEDVFYNILKFLSIVSGDAKTRALQLFFSYISGAKNSHKNSNEVGLFALKSSCDSLTEADHDLIIEVIDYTIEKVGKEEFQVRMIFQLIYEQANVLRKKMELFNKCLLYTISFLHHPSISILASEVLYFQVSAF